MEYSEIYRGNLEHTTIPDFPQLFVLNKTFSHSLLQHSMKEPILRPMIYYVSDHRITKHNRHATIIGDHLLAPFQKPHRKPVLRMHRSEIVSANWQLRSTQRISGGLFGDTFECTGAPVSHRCGRRGTSWMQHLARTNHERPSFLLGSDGGGDGGDTHLLHLFISRDAHQKLNSPNSG